MYRDFKMEEIIKHLSIYSNPTHSKAVNIEKVRPFFENPTYPELVKIMRDSRISKEEKQSVLVALNTSLNFTSIKPYISDKSTLLLLLSDIPLKPIYTLEEVACITRYVINKSKNTNIYSKLQVEDVRKSLDFLGAKYELSSNGFQDIDWNKSSAKADGIIHLPNEEIVLYLRYGTGTGGAQNDRFRNMFDTAKKNPNQKIIFIVDGPEAILQYGLCSVMFNEHNYENAVWTTSKLLKFIDLKTMRLCLK